MTMKKFLLLAVMVMFTEKMVAQDVAQDDNNGIRLGLTLAPQISWMNAGDKNISANGSYFGFSYGLLLDYVFKKNYAFSSGVVVSYDGGKLTYLTSTKFNTYGDSLFVPATVVNYRNQYIEIPITLKLRTNQIGYITYFGQFGLQGGVRIRSRSDVSNATLSINEIKIDFSKDVTLPDLGLLIGGGIEYEITGNTALLAALQFYNGFIDVTDNPKGYATKSTLNHLRLQLGVYF